MSKFISFIALSLLMAIHSYALSPADQYNVDQLVNGGPVSIRSAAQSLYHTGSTNPEVLDVLAEVLLQNYHKGDRNNIDAMSWASKALGNSGLSRYRSTLEEVAENGAHRKLKKYAKKSLKQLARDDAKQYKKGTVSLAKLKGKTAKAAPQKRSTPAATTGKKASLSAVQAGMSMEQVYAMVGHPTATTSHQTGKAWIPFNYKGGDSARMHALYKGQGRVIFSNESHYSSVWRVIEVRIDPGETGYP